MKRSMTMRLTITVEDGVPGHPKRFGEVLGKVQALLEQGARAGTFDHTFMIPDEGYQEAVVDFDVLPTKPVMRWRDGGRLSENPLDT